MCKTVLILSNLLKLFLNGFKWIFFSIVVISQYLFFGFPGLSCSMWLLQSYTQHPSILFNNNKKTVLLWKKLFDSPADVSQGVVY